MNNKYIYYVELNGQKKGPLSIEELRELKIPSNTLIWRNDNSDWLTAKNFEELKDNLFETPPLLPVEKKKIEAKVLYKQQKKTYLQYYLIGSLVLGLITSLIAIFSYENWPGKGKQSEFGPSTDFRYTARYLDPTYGWDYSRNNESFYSERQIFILRPVLAFFSTIYLSKEEQGHYLIIFVYQIISSFIILAIPLIVLWTIGYFQPNLLKIDSKSSLQKSTSELKQKMIQQRYDRGEITFEEYQSEWNKLSK